MENTKAIIEDDDLFIRVGKLIQAKKDVVARMQTLIVADNFKVLDFTEATKDGAVEYIEGLTIRNLTSPLLHVVGVTVLLVEASKKVTFDMHQHDDQTQVAYVKEGTIITENGLEFTEGETYFVSKKHTHAITYLEGAKVILSYYPNLKSV